MKFKSNESDKTIWTANSKGVFKVSSAWKLLRSTHQSSWIDTMTWNKVIPFKMSFIGWRALRDKIPTDLRISRMGIAIPSKCVC
ncbi:hypothetical protein RDI58_024290 [Solanum bulbocastanum]|uniref:Reverse transcriptase zinc-binding domain-containing protein n=1 Tax=Solanum bulbocastanum TaxID=147425 RepID=A0AAN8T2Q5_SOLBU